MKTKPLRGLAELPANETTTRLILDFLDWLRRERRPYVEVMDVWRTSCPRLTIWEDAVDRGLVVREQDAAGGVPVVAVTALGRRLLAARGPTPPPR